MNLNDAFDVAVVGAGVFGAWTAYKLHEAGASVVLIDAYGPGNSRSSSGGESRMIRMGYGADQIYTLMAQSSLRDWKQLFATVDSELFQPTGILWLARGNDAYCTSTLLTLEQCGIKHGRLDRNAIASRYPQLRLGNAGDVDWGILEPDSGVLMARRAVKTVVLAAVNAGVSYLEDSISDSTGFEQQLLESIQTISGRRISANHFVFACGPWLPKIFPELARLIQVTRQEVFFFGLPAGNGDRFGAKQMPAWIDFNNLVYGVPSLDARGFKVAIDAHGPEFDPDTGDRIVSADSLTAVRRYLAQRMPELAAAAVTETRVCQYENTSNGDFLIDRHPRFENVWVVGGGSGHGFKHGPAIGEYATLLISGSGKVEPRFSFATKATVHRREVF